MKKHVALTLALALALASLVLADRDVAAQEGEPLYPECLPGSESGLVCDFEGPAPTERLGCLPVNTFEQDGKCFTYEPVTADGGCFVGSTPDPDGLPRCVRELSSLSLELGLFCQSGFEKRGDQCLQSFVLSDYGLTCAEGVLVLDRCEIYTKAVVADTSCPVLPAIVEVEGTCFDRIEVDAEGGCTAPYVLSIAEPGFCEVEVQPVRGASTCAEPNARLDEPFRAMCVAYGVPAGLPGLDCAGRGAGLPACNDIAEHRQNGTFDGVLLPGEPTTISFFDCEGAGSASFRIRSGDTTVVDSVAIGSSQPGMYTGEYIAPPAGTYDIQFATTCPDGSTNNRVYDLVQFPSCNGVAATIDLNANPGSPATSGDDVIVGTSGPDTIDALAGDDNVCGGEGDDRLSGAAGDDIISGGGGRDMIRGNSGNDVLFGGDAIDRMWGHGGNDELIGQGGSDRLRAGDGDDIIRAGSGADRAWGGAGNDMMFGMGGQDRMWGEDGNDEMQGNFQSDRMWGGPGDDVLRGAGGKDRIRGDAGDDMMFGGNNVDFLDGGEGVDTADGQAGKDNPLVDGVSGCIAETTISC